VRWIIPSVPPVGSLDSQAEKMEKLVKVVGMLRALFTLNNAARSSALPTVPRAETAARQTSRQQW
jgi:hypothetical protein